MEGQINMFSKVPIDLAIQIAFELGISYARTYVHTGLVNVVEFNYLQHAKGCGAQIRDRRKNEEMPGLFNCRTDMEIKAIKECNELVDYKNTLIELCK